MVRKLVTILVCAALLAALAVTEQRLVSHLTDDALEKTQQILVQIRSGELEGGVEHVRERQVLTVQNIL